MNYLDNLDKFANLQIEKKLVLVRQEIADMCKIGKIVPTGHNNYLKFKYYELCDILPAITLLCTKYCICMHINIGLEKSTLKLTSFFKKSDKVYALEKKEEEKEILSSKEIKEEILFCFENGKNERLDLQFQNQNFDKKFDFSDNKFLQDAGARATYLTRYLLRSAFLFAEEDQINKNIKKEVQKKREKDNLEEKKIEEKKLKNNINNILTKKRIEDENKKKYLKAYFVEESKILEKVDDDFIDERIKVYNKIYDELSLEVQKVSK